MADSIINDNDASDDFADDLDAMLNEIDTSDDDQDGLIDDEDAIDQLIMKDVLDVAEEVTDEVDKSADTALDSSIERAINQREEDKNPADVLDELTDYPSLDTVNNESKMEEDVFAEIDEFAEDENNSDTSNQAESDAEELIENLDEIDVFAESEPEPKTEPEPEDSFETILNEEFDISSEEDEFSTEEKQIDEFPEDEIELEIDDLIDEESTAPVSPPPASSPPISSQPEPSVDLEKVNSAIETLTTQLGQLETENITLKANIEELLEVTNKPDPKLEDIENLQKDQRKLRKTMRENQEKTPVVVYIVMAVAIIALLIGIVFGIMSFGTQADVDDLTELALTLEEEIEIIAANDISTEVKNSNATVQTLFEKNISFTTKLDDLNNAFESSPLQGVVDDLVKQNDHAQQAIELLLAKVESLEKGKFSAASARKKKKNLIKVEWVVNMVSFKQEWYAKRKADEFEKKGVPTDITQVTVKNQQWYRLRVKGFKSKYEAAAYAVKVKKTLNLSSVWVTKG